MFTGRINGVGDYSITPLNLGGLTVPAGTPMGGRSLVVQAFLVAHPGGTLLFDTGLGDQSAKFDHVLAPITRRPLEEALAAAGRKVGDVAAVVNCHLHYDHCGGNPTFPGVAIYVQARDYGVRKGMNFCIPERVDFPGADLRVLDGEAAIMRGMRAVPTPGHTPGHQSLVIDDRDGPVILAGQAAYTAVEFADPEDEPARGFRTAWDSDAFLRSISVLKAIKPRRVYFAHDEEYWEAAG